MIGLARVLACGGALALMFATAPAPALPGQHVLIGSGIDQAGGVSFTVAATERAQLGHHGSATVGGDTFEIDCFTLADHTTHHVAYLTGVGRVASYYIVVSTGGFVPDFQILARHDDDPCDVRSADGFAGGQGAFFIGPEERVEPPA